MPPLNDPPADRQPRPSHPPAALDPQGPLDEGLIEAVMQGDKQAFAQIVARYQGPVFGYLRARLLQPSDAEDLTQEVFFRCYRFRDKLQIVPTLRPWLLSIARNVLSEYVRKIKRRREVAWTELCLEVDYLAEEQAEDSPQQELSEQLPTCLDALGTNARQAIEMRYDGRLPLAEIGNKLHRSEGATRLLMHRARQALKNCLTRGQQGECRDE